MMKLQLEVLKNNFYHIENPILGSEVCIIYNMESDFLLEMYEKSIEFRIIFNMESRLKRKWWIKWQIEKL